MGIYPEISPRREKGRGGVNPQLDIALDTSVFTATEDRLEVSERVSLAQVVGLRLGLEFRGEWAWDSS